MIVVGIIALLAAIAVPAFSRAGLRARELRLKKYLKEVRDAQMAAESDTGLMPAPNLLTSTASPGGGWVRGPMGTGWSYLPIPPGTWHGPYLVTMPQFDTSFGPACSWNSTPSYAADAFFIDNPALSTEGTPYNSW